MPWDVGFDMPSRRSAQRGRRGGGRQLAARLTPGPSALPRLQCTGPSMLPTFNQRGDVALLEHLSVLAERIEVGDVVVARSVQNPRHNVCKRVLGLEGDRVVIPHSKRWGAGRTVTVRAVCEGAAGGGGKLACAGGWRERREAPSRRASAL